MKFQVDHLIFAWLRQLRLFRVLQRGRISDHWVCQGVNKCYDLFTSSFICSYPWLLAYEKDFSLVAVRPGNVVSDLNDRWSTWTGDLSATSMHQGMRSETYPPTVSSDTYPPTELWDLPAYWVVRSTCLTGPYDYRYTYATSGCHHSMKACMNVYV